MLVLKSRLNPVLGVIPEDLLAIIRILESRGVFTIDQYNQCIERLEFSSYESGDKPYPVPISKKVKKLKGKAVSNWVHLRNWPVLLKTLAVNIDSNDSVIILGLKLHEICERMTASEFYTYEIDIMEADMKKTITFIITFFFIIIYCVNKTINLFSCLPLGKDS